MTNGNEETRVSVCEFIGVVITVFLEHNRIIQQTEHHKGGTKCSFRTGFNVTGS